MTKDEAREILIEYNRYRRGEVNSPMPNPTKAGQAIDVAIQALDYGKESEQCDYRKSGCVNNGMMIDGKWVCMNHIHKPK
jgi:hypothetical protein